jgi:hypothetical protein
MQAFPLEARVILHGLVKAPELNGKTGVIKSVPTNGRQQVHLEDSNNNVALKVDNLKYEGREIATLSVKELKLVLKHKHVPDTELGGITKRELKVKLTDMAVSSEEIAHILAMAKAPNYKPTAYAPAYAANTTTVPGAQAADQLSNMSPEQLRQQAHMMRSMDPDTIRRTNPQLAQMSNAQIQNAATQMEQMANNPEMMKMAADQMKNMSPQELQRMQAQMDGATAPVPAPLPNVDGIMANMTPDQLRMQSQMMKSTPPAEIRKLNPQLAHMSDDQILMAANQFQLMADNPDMMKMAMDQVKNMSPADLAKMQAGAATPETMANPAKILETMDPKALKQMMTTVQKNPEMLKQFAAMSGMQEDHLAEGLEMFAGFGEEKLELALKVVQKAQKAKNIWTDVNTKTGGHLMKIVILVGIICVYALVHRSLLGGAVAAATVVTPLFAEAVPEAVPVMEDEFAEEL